MTATAQADPTGRRTDAVGRGLTMPDSIPSRTVDQSFRPHAADYAAWRADKLRELEPTGGVPTIPLENPLQLKPEERHALLAEIAKRNFAFYEISGARDRDTPLDGSVLEAMCRQFGLAAPVNNPAADGFGLSRIEYVDGREGGTGPGNRARYIPYTNRRLNWHTDGYYNDELRKVRSFVLHCVQDAEHGGENVLMDPEILYILLRDEHPHLLQALCQEDAFSIPADRGDNGSGRMAFTGPVFSVDAETGALYTRFTQRRHHIHWLDDPDVAEAVKAVDRILQGPHPALVRRTLRPGQGVLCNNVLHCRSAFEDRQGGDHGRLLFRLRFNQRIGHAPEKSPGII